MFQGLNALVTGSVRGIGLAIAQGLERAGATVWTHGRDPMHKPEFGGRYVAADLSSDAGVEQLSRSLSAVVNRLDILVNNAGVEIAMPIEQFLADTMDMTWQVNARAPVQLIHGLLPLLKSSGRASVINVTSIHERTAYASNLPYCMSKAALAMATRVAAIELAPFGIRVNNLAPGAIETDINRDVIEGIGRQNFASWIPAGRVGSTDDIVGPALFLASDASRYVTGTTLFVDGAYRENLVRYRPDDLLERG